MAFESGFIALLGSPNVGKSTLLNALVGTKIAIVSKKPQTTRNRITGVLTRKDFQMIFMDTPGLHTPKNKLGEFMVKTAETAARDVDAVLFVVDAKAGAKERDMEILERLSKGSVPLLIALNKIDAVDAARIEEVEESLRQFDKKVVRISAKQGIGLTQLIDDLKPYLEEGPMFYPEDMVSDQPERVIAGELIREKALKSIGKEIPHGIGVEIEKMQHDDVKDILHIDAIIYCEKDSHKGIIIGAGGRMLKKIASAAREDMETLFGSKVFLQVWVKVKPDWRNKVSMLRTLGYEDN
ncbi:MAG: GTPase Era [Christensenella sp.]|nr:GTPase Era [Christensenella sp.]